MCVCVVFKCVFKWSVLQAYLNLITLVLFFSSKLLTLQVDVKTEVLSYVCLMLKNLLFLYPFFPKDHEK